MSLNSVCLIGRMVRDPECRALNDGTSVCNFTLAVDDDYKDKDGNKVTDFIDCTAFRHTAEYIVKYQVKGSQVAVCGKMKSRKWMDKDGNKRVSWYVKCDNAYGVGSRQERTQDTGGYGEPGYTTQTGGQPGYAIADKFSVLTDDDPQLPF